MEIIQLVQNNVQKSIQKQKRGHSKTTIKIEKQKVETYQENDKANINCKLPTTI